MRILRPWVMVLTAGSLGCGAMPPVPRGTVQMADTLARLYAAAIRSPEHNPFLNRERAAQLQTLLNQVPGPAFPLRTAVAFERLAAGETRTAIAEIESLLRDAEISIDSVSKSTKPMFDLLALAYLRLGEQENCLLDPSARVCILPLDGPARHTRQEGARKAIAIYERLLQRFPEDRGSQWLLNVAYMAVGEYPSRVPKPYLIPNLDGARDRPFPLFFNIAADVGVAINGLAGGLCVADFNRDGLLDLFTTSWGLNDPVHLFLADGRGGYVDRTAAMRLPGIWGGLNTVHADYDNDGYEDILILRGAWLGVAGAIPNSLLRNRGDGTFEDVTFAAGVGSFHPTQTAAWADFNLDGFLDLFVGNESSPKSTHRSELFVNNRDGTFTEVSHQVGIDLAAFVKAVAWGDVNNDGLPDLFVSVWGGPNRLFLNRGGRAIDTWRFDDVSTAAGIGRPRMSFPAWFWDYDNDGWEDLLVLSYDIAGGGLQDAVAMEYLGLPPAILRPDGVSRPVESSRLYHNGGNGVFADVSREAGLADKVIYAMGSNFGDLDNDGWLDFYLGTGNPDLGSIIPNRMFHSVAGRRFEEVTLAGGFAHLQKGHATAFADLDRDGDEDIYMVVGGAYAGDLARSVLFENPGTPHSWITLELEGRSANRSAIGARVHLVVADASGATHELWRTVGTGGSFGAGSLELHVGLGTAVRVQRLRITWPDAGRTASEYDDVAINRAYHLVQGEALVPRDRPAVPFRAPSLSEPSHRHREP